MFLYFWVDGNAKLEPGKTEYNKLPIVLVLIEGGVEAMETASNLLKDNNPVIAIDGSGGAADFLASCYYQHDKRFAESFNYTVQSQQTMPFSCITIFVQPIKTCLCISFFLIFCLS